MSATRVYSIAISSGDREELTKDREASVERATSNTEIPRVFRASVSRHGGRRIGARAVRGEHRSEVAYQLFLSVLLGERRAVPRIDDRRAVLGNASSRKSLADIRRRRTRDRAISARAFRSRNRSRIYIRSARAPSIARVCPFSRRFNSRKISRVCTYSRRAGATTIPRTTERELYRRANFVSTCARRVATDCPERSIVYSRYRASFSFTVPRRRAPTAARVALFRDCTHARHGTDVKFRTPGGGRIFCLYTLERN